jgi:hypothetical protein
MVASEPWPATTSPAPPARHREAIRVLHTTRAAIVAAGADARRQPKALIVAAPSDPVAPRATLRALVLTAQRVLAARREAKQPEAELCQPARDPPLPPRAHRARQRCRVLKRTAINPPSS